MPHDKRAPTAPTNLRSFARPVAQGLPPAAPAGAQRAQSLPYGRPAHDMISHILLIERDVDVREALTGVLRMHRWRVTAFAEPAAAHASLRAGLAPDLLLIDCPEVGSAMDFLADATANGAPLHAVPVIAMVASEHTPTGPLLKILKKPFAIGSLLTLIRGL